MSTSRGLKNVVKIKVLGGIRWAGATSPSLTWHLYPNNMGKFQMSGGATAESEGTAVAKRES